MQALTMIGLDNDGDFLLSELLRVALVVMLPEQKSFYAGIVLPVYDNGERACRGSGLPHCWTKAILGEVGLGCKRIDMLRELLWINLGYPYELQKLQSSNLTRLANGGGD